MSEIIPRWEWRTFGEGDFGEAEGRIKASGDPRVRESSEVYILSSQSDENTKIRFELMDIKTLKQVNSAGLEQWFPALKAEFPLGSEQLEQVCEIWCVDPPTYPGEFENALDLNSFLRDIVDPHPYLFRVDVSKERHGYLLEGCIVEIADLRFDEQAIRTVAVEGEDPDQVMDLVRSLSLDGMENINYIKALKRYKGISG